MYVNGVRRLIEYNTSPEDRRWITTGRNGAIPSGVKMTPLMSPSRDKERNDHGYEKHDTRRRQRYSGRQNR